MDSPNSSLDGGQLCLICNSSFEWKPVLLTDEGIAETQNTAKRILIKYLVERCEDKHLKLNLTSPNFPLKFCNECSRLAKEVQDLHLQLEKIQMMLIDKLKQAKELVVRTSIKFREWSNGSGRSGGRDVDKEGEMAMARVIQLTCQFHTSVDDNDTNKLLDVPLVFLEKYVGSKAFPEIVSSSTPNQKKTKNSIIDCGATTEFIPKGLQKSERSLDEAVPVRNPQVSESVLQECEDWAQVKDELEVEEAGDEYNDDDFDPMNLPSDSDDGDSPELSSARKKRSCRSRRSNCTAEAGDKTQFTCAHCNMICVNFSKFIMHTRRCQPGTKLRCALCPSSDEGKMYSLRDELPRHLDDIHEMSTLRIECDFPSCSERFYMSNSANYHKKLHSLKFEQLKMEKKLKCDSSPASFDSAFAFVGQKRRVHGHSKVKCHLCPALPGRYFSSTFGYNHHLRYFHRDREKDAAKFPCSQCPKVFILNKVRNQHEKLTHGERKFSCSNCPFVTNTKRNLEQHLERRHPSPNSTSIICELCGFTAKTKEYLRAHHKRMHDPEYQLKHKMKLAAKKFGCSSCPKKFWNRSLLKDHMLTHSKEKSFRCDWCGHAFKRKLGLRMHMTSVHEVGEMNHNCPHCSKSFLIKRQLESHMLVHSNKKKFECASCGARFKREQSLNVHTTKLHAIGGAVVVNEERSTSRGKWVCEECGNDFSDRSKLERHLLVHKKGGRTWIRKRGMRKQENVPKKKVLECDLCQKGFRRETRLELHKRKMHTVKVKMQKTVKVCEECGKDFCSQSQLDRHLLVHKKGGRTRERKRGARHKQAQPASQMCPELATND